MRSVLFITRSTRGTGGMQTYTRTLLRALALDPSINLHVVSLRGSVTLLPFFCVYAFFRALCFRGDVCHIGDALLSPIALLLRFFRSDIRLTLTTYGLDVIYPCALYQRVLLYSLPVFDAVATISEATKAELLTRSVIPRRIHVIAPGIDLPPLRQHSARSSNRLLILGRQIQRKGTTWFLTDVMPRLLSTHPSIHLTIAGDGPELPRIREVIDALGLTNSVTVLGGIDDRTKEHLLMTSSLLVVPNIAVSGDMEGFGLVCTEALAHNLPVIASDREGIRDAVVAEITGLFFMSEDPASAVSVTLRALSFAWSATAMRHTLETKYSTEAMYAQYRTHVF